MSRTRIVPIAVLLLCIVAHPARAQTLRGRWVQRSEEQIDRARRTALRIIVHDAAGRQASGARVRVEQVRHAFPVGFTVGNLGLAQFDSGLEVWRCFNAVDLTRITHWPLVQPSPDRRDVEMLRHVVGEAVARRLAVRFGRLVSADPGRNPDWVGAMRGEGLGAVLEAHVGTTVRDFGPFVDQFDVYADALDHRYVEQRLGESALRRMYETARADAPRAQMCVRFHDCLTGPRLNELVDRVNGLRQAFVPVDLVAIEQRLGGSLLHTPLARALSLLDRLGVPVVLVGLEVSGPTEAAAALNLETALRSVFANSNVRGIWFAGPGPEHLSSPRAALVDRRGEPTAPGRVLDGLFHGAWWTDLHATADELGNVQARVFTGEHRVSATLADGGRIETRVWIEASPETRVILLEPGVGSEVAVQRSEVSGADRRTPAE